MSRRKDERKKLYKFVYLHVYLTHGDFPFFFSVYFCLRTRPHRLAAWFFGRLLHGAGVSVFFFFFFPSTQGDRRAGGSLL